MKHALIIALNDLRQRLVERDTLVFSLILPLLFTVVIGAGMDAAPNASALMSLILFGMGLVAAAAVQIKRN